MGTGIGRGPGPWAVDGRRRWGLSPFFRDLHPSFDARLGRFAGPQVSCMSVDAPLLVESGPEPITRLEECERRIGYVFNNRTLLLAALTHASGADSRVRSNERLWPPTNGWSSSATPFWAPSSARCFTSSTPTTWRAT